MLTLTRQEALEFVERRLNVGEAEKLLAENRVGFLDDLIVAFHNNVPFQTMTNMAVSPERRRVPSVEEIKHDVYSGRGGMCIALNGYFHAVLVALGYDCYLTEGRMWNADPNTHAVIIVRNLFGTDDSRLVEVGVGYPTLGAVPLDFDLESPTSVELVWRGRVVRVQEEEGGDDHGSRCPVFLRQRKQIDPEVVARLGFGVRENPDQWNTVYRFKLEPQSFAELYEHIDANVFRNVSHGLNRTLRLMQWHKNRAVIVLNDLLVRETGQGVCLAVRLESDEEIADTIVSEFPVFGRDLVEKAIAQWRQLPGK